MKFVVTFDLDGVLCRPPFGINPGKGRHRSRTASGKHGLLWMTERWRYLGRKPMPGAVVGFRELSARYDCRVLSARSEAARGLTEAWFARYFGSIPEINLRAGWHETPAAYKARRVQELGAIAHFEDDPHTANWLSDLLPAVFLIDWPRNHWLEADHVHRIARLDQAAAVLERLSHGDAERRKASNPGL